MEARGLPSLGIASSEFVEAAAAQSKSLGFEPSMIFVPHPIQDRTDEELRALADQTLDEILAGIRLDA